MIRSTIANEINGPSWGPKKNKVNIDELQKKIDLEDVDSISNNLSIKTIHVNSSRSNEDSIKAVSMIRSYRQRGHLIAKLDPLELIRIYGKSMTSTEKQLKSYKVN